MKTLPGNGKVSGFTLIELLVVIAVIAVLAAMIFPHIDDGHPRSYRTMCMSNLKQVDLTFIIYTSDNGGKFPMEVPVINGGTMELISNDHAFPHFQKAYKNLHQPSEAMSLKTLVCPKDATRQVATNLEALNDLNLSYFLNTDASLTTNNPSQMIFAGESDLSLNRQPVKAGLLTVTTNIDLNWTGEFHPKGGNLAFVDGHVEWSKTNELNSWIQRQPIATNRLCIP